MFLCMCVCVCVSVRACHGLKPRTSNERVMGNTNAKPHPRPRNKKQVHWKAAGNWTVVFFCFFLFFFFFVFYVTFLFCFFVTVINVRAFVRVREDASRRCCVIFVLRIRFDIFIYVYGLQYTFSFENYVI